MSKNKFTELRKKAETILNDDKINLNSEEFKNDLQKIIQELSINQIELELQNDELEKIQKELQLEKNRFADLFKNAPVGYLLLSKTGKIIDFNSKISEILKIPISLIKNKPFPAFLSPNQASNFYNYLTSVFEDNEKIEKETIFNIITADKTKRILKLKSNIFTDPIHKNNYCRSIVEDITEKKDVERKNEELYYRLENSMIGGNMAWWEMELPSGKIIFNDNKSKMLGYDAIDFKHYKDFMEYVHPEDYEKTMLAMQNHLDGKTELYKCDYRIKNINGQYLWFRDIGKITKKQKGQIVLNGIVSNITASKHQAEMLEQLNEELRSTLEDLAKVNKSITEERNQFLEILDTIPQYIYISDENYQVLFANKSLKNEIGTELVGKKCYEAIRNNPKVCKNCPKQSVFKTGKILYREDYNEQLDKYLYTMDTTINWFDGKKARFEISTDITPIKETQQKLKDNEEKYRLLVEKSPIGIVQIGQDAKVTDWNKQMEKITGLSKNQIKNEPFWKISAKLAPEKSETIEKYLELEINKALNSEDVAWLDKKIENKYKNSDGSVRDVEAEHFVIPSSTGNRLGAVITDITDKKIAQQKILQSQQNLKEVIKNVPLAVFVARQLEGGKFVLVNDVASEYLGYTKEELLNMKVTDLDYEAIERNDEENLWKKLEKNKTYHIESKHVRKDGSTYDAEIHFSVIDFEEKPAIISVVNDITKRNKNEKLLKDLNQTKDKFFSIIAHDLKSPFNSIIGFSDLLKSNLNKYDRDKIQLFVDSIYQTSKNTFKLLEDLLEWARSQSGKIPFKPEITKIEYLLQETTALLSNQANSKNIQILTNFDEEISIVVDFHMITTVLRNLTSNAIKFTPENGKIEINSFKKNKKIIFEVKDNGIGMSNEKISKLFKIGEKVTSKGTNNESGTGLGLLLAKEFIDKHNGEIWVESQQNIGTSFFFALPHII